jgi:hypothetical protein
MASRTKKPEPGTRQKAAVARITKIDPDAVIQVVGGWIKATYTPSWERGRNIGGTFRPNPNPQAITLAVDEAGKLGGWGYTSPANFPALIKRCPFGSDLTTPESMKAALKERAEARKPEPKEEPETTKAEPKAPTKRARKTPARKRKTTTTTKARTRRSGVQVVAKK